MQSELAEECQKIEFYFMNLRKKNYAGIALLSSWKLAEWKAFSIFQVQKYILSEPRLLLIICDFNKYHHLGPFVKRVCYVLDSVIVSI